MIKSIKFSNFKVLRDATLPLSRFTLLVGPNGSGKGTAMQGISMAANPGNYSFADVASAYVRSAGELSVDIDITWAFDYESIDLAKRLHRDTITWRSMPDALTLQIASSWSKRGNVLRAVGPEFGSEFEISSEEDTRVREEFASFRIFSFDPGAMTAPVLMRPGIKLESNGAGLAGVLENLRDQDDTRFQALNEELGRWLPEFDRIQFDTPKEGHKAFWLRTRRNHQRINAVDLSHGTLLAIAFLTIAYSISVPSIVCFEEPERGIHPRLLRNIRDAMYRLAYPEDFGETRNPVQVIATTHSPYMLDLYKDIPEEIVIAEKSSDGATFQRLSDKSELSELIEGAPLGEIWYSGILGGVPVGT
jgi:predicted ATPase